MTTTSPNQEGVEGTACEEVWMITGESVILFTYASFVRNPFILPHQEGIFLGWLARDYTSLRNSWETALDLGAQRRAQTYHATGSRWATPETSPTTLVWRVQTPPHRPTCLLRKSLHITRW